MLHLFKQSINFILGKPNSQPSHPDYVPSQFVHLQTGSLGKGKKRLQRFESATKRRAKLFKDCTEHISDDSDSPCDISGIEQLDVTADAETADAEPTVPTIETLSPVRPPAAASSSSADVFMVTSTPGLSSPLPHIERRMMFDEMNNLRREKADLAAERDLLADKLNHAQLNSATIKDNNGRSKFYTGLSWEVFTQLSLFLSTVITTSAKCMLPATEQLFLTLVKLRQNLPFELISHQAGVDVSTVSRSFWKTIEVLYRKIGFMVRWPERETLNETLPAIFKLHFPRLTGIMDCFEMFIDRPKNLKARAEVYSNYKKHSTVKVFIVCSPRGAVTYLSTAWGGRASDVEMVRASDFISPKYHQPRDQLLADRGFTLVEEFVVSCGAELLIPSFTKGKKQLSPKEVEVSRSISTVRIHIERVIGLLKNRFKILQGPLTINLIKSQKDEAEEVDIASIDKLVDVCTTLVNIAD